MALRQVATEEVGDEIEMVAPPPAQAARPQAPARMPNLGPLIAAIRLGVMVLNARFLLLLALLASFYLGQQAVTDPTPWRVGAECLYVVTVLWPVAWLAAIKG